MKKLIILILMVIPFSLIADDMIDSFAIEFFGHSIYILEESRYGNDDILFILQSVDKSQADLNKMSAYQNRDSELFNKAIIIRKVGDTYEPCVYIDETLTTNYRGDILFDSSLPRSHTFYGWTLNLSEHAFSLTVYSNKGFNVSEGPIFLWDAKSKNFSYYFQDRSQW